MRAKEDETAHVNSNKYFFIFKYFDISNVTFTVPVISNIRY